MLIPTTVSDLRVPVEERAVKPGDLDGITMMRYAHVYRERASGGVEQYLRRLDSELLRRHRLTVLQTHLVRYGTDCTVETETVGLGRIVWMPVPIRHCDARLSALPERLCHVYRYAARLHEKEGRGRFGASVSAIQELFRHRAGHLRYRTAVLSDHLSGLFATRRVDLLVLHWLSYDADFLISSALKRDVPCVFINHFDNARLLLPENRTSVVRAKAIGVVSSQNIPGDLQGRCVDLSDAVDTEFFNPGNARPVRLPASPVVLLPARIQRGKGHHDLIDAARILTARHVDLVLCFAGAVDSESLHQELHEHAKAMGLENRTMFLGERTMEELRDWYAGSSVVALPSDSEGLPRVLLEAQAMQRPVVAYQSGGTAEALVPDETGFLVCRGDVTALADRISSLLGDRENSLRIGMRGRRFVSLRFSVSALVQRHESFYLRALAGAKR